ncbi:antitoxin VbhA family protein [[Mycobacterium] fortunisiensis]|uniref:antitoxin VbhA family protein n=1 Tax=[Mycobacterium] fortunisiensis TaxID=2600579 RepID=UPI001C27383D
MDTPDIDNSRRWPPCLDRLGVADRRAVISAIACGRLSGWNPSRPAVERLAALAAGEMSIDVYIRLVLTEVSS